MNRNISRADNAPPALSLRFPEAGPHSRHGVGHATRVRHGVETVGCGNRANTNRLEKNIESRMTRHLTDPTRLAPREYRGSPKPYATIYRPFNKDFCRASPAPALYTTSARDIREVPLRMALPDIKTAQ